MVAKKGSVDNHNQRFSKPQNFETGSSASVRYHKVSTLHVLGKIFVTVANVFC